MVLVVVNIRTRASIIHPVPLAAHIVRPALAVQAPEIFAQDGTYLGRLSANPYAPDSTSNPYGVYGSPFSPTSINNSFSVYGSPFSPQSANNPYTTTAPVLVMDDDDQTMAPALVFDDDDPE